MNFVMKRLPKEVCAEILGPKFVKAVSKLKTKDDRRLAIISYSQLFNSRTEVVVGSRLYARYLVLAVVQSNLFSKQTKAAMYDLITDHSCLGFSVDTIHHIEKNRRSIIEICKHQNFYGALIILHMLDYTNGRFPEFGLIELKDALSRLSEIFDMMGKSITEHLS
jgi:hypothetical protein